MSTEEEKELLQVNSVQISLMTVPLSFNTFISAG